MAADIVPTRPKSLPVTPSSQKSKRVEKKSRQSWNSRKSETRTMLILLRVLDCFGEGVVTEAQLPAEAGKPA
jgi:hypothetical protein